MDAYDQALTLALEHTRPARNPRIGAPLEPGELYQLLTASGEFNRIGQARFAWDMYTGDQLRYLPRLPAESPAEFLRRPHKQFLNLTRAVIDILSQLYRRPVTRLIETDPADDMLRERIQRAYDRNPTQRLLNGIDKLARLQGVAAIRIGYDAGEIRLWPWPAHRLCVIPDALRPESPACVVALPAGDGNVAHVWDAQRVSVVREGRLAQESEHGYGRIPFAFVHDRLPVDGFWVEGRGRSLCHGNAEINAKLSGLAHTVAMQGFGVMEIVNPDPAQDIAIGPARAIRFTVSGNDPFGVNFKAPNAPIAELIAHIEFSVRNLLKSQRVPESVLSVHSAGDVSGVSILAQQTPVLEDRVERQQAFRVFEQDLADAMLAVLRVPENVQGSARIKLDFPEPQLEQSATERMAIDDWRLKHGMTTPWQLMQRDDPDRYTDEAAAKVQWQQNTQTRPTA